MLYETGGEYIAVEQELKIMNDYIALEKLRYDESLHINFSYDVEDMKQALPPLLLIPLVENAFKHGVMKSTRASWIKVKLKCDEQSVHVTVTNSAELVAPGKGIGLINLKSQLNYLYAGRYEMKISNEVPEEFSVNLILAR